VIHQAEKGELDSEEVHALTKDYATPKNLKSLLKLKEHFGKDTSVIKTTLSSIIDEASLKSKCKSLNLDVRLVDDYYEDIQFLFKTRLIYSIVGMKNTTAAGPTKHDFKEIVNTKGKTDLCIKKEGKWVPIQQIREELVWDSKETALASKSNPNERWNYFDDGLVPIDRFYHHEAAHEENYPLANAQLHPVAQLSQKEMKQLLEHAKNFTGFNTENNPNKTGENLNCVIQVVSHPRPMFEKACLQNLNALAPVHCGIRIVMADGSVYSTGFGSTLEQDTYNEGLRKYLGTINGQPTILDYEEFRPHDGRIVTNIPIGDKRAENILKQLNTYREGTVRFNIIKQNCMRLGTNVMSMAGVDLNIRETFSTVLYRALPNLETIPVIGKPMKSLVGRVKKVSHAISSKMPEPIKKIFNQLNRIVFFVPNKIGTLISNLLVLAMGGLVASPQNACPLVASKQRNLEDLESLDSFSKLLNNLFDEEASDSQHSSIFINWQLQQASTDVFQYSGQPNMNVVPPQTEEEKQYSEQRKTEFWKIFQNSTPMTV
jgi:hypothetical protein